MSIRSFKAKFRFQPEMHLKIGIERECFLTRNGRIVPIAAEIIPAINHPAIGYELSACQLESRTGPSDISDVFWDLREMDSLVFDFGAKLGFTREFLEVAPDDMPLDVYPDSGGRFQKIAQQMSKEVLLAACQVAGTHIHVGMKDHETALRVYNMMTCCYKDLVEYGGSPDGKRLELYNKVAPKSEPTRYEDWEDFYQQAVERGFVDNPKNCWDLIRISKHGTIEFRMFGTTSDLRSIDIWANICHGLCQSFADD